MWKVASVGGGAAARDFEEERLQPQRAHAAAAALEDELDELAEAARGVVVAHGGGVAERLEHRRRLHHQRGELVARAVGQARRADPPHQVRDHLRHVVRFPAPDSPLTITAWFVRARSSPRYAASATE